MSTIRWQDADSGTITRLDALMQHGSVTIIKQASHRDVRRIVHDGLDVHVKRYVAGVGRLRGGRARHEFEITREVARRGVPTLEALAWGTDDDGSYLVTRTLPQAQSLLEVFARSTGDSCRPAWPTPACDNAGVGHAGLREPPVLRRSMAVALGEFMARTHLVGVCHRDLHPGNLLVRTVEGRIELYLIDLDAVRLFDASAGRQVTWHVENLVMFNRWFSMRCSRSDRFRFFSAYSRHTDFADNNDGAREIESRTLVDLRQFLTALDRRCLGGNRHFRRFRESGARGYVVTGVDPSEFIRHEPTDVTVLKQSASSVVVACSAEVDGQRCDVVLKRVNATRWTDPFAALFRPPAALHAYRMGHALLLRGLPTPRPLAVWHQMRYGLPGDGFLLAERIPEALGLDKFVESLQASEHGRLRELLRRLGWLLRRLHQWDLSHRDLKAANLLVSPCGWQMGQRGLVQTGKDGGDHLWFVDLAGLHKLRKLSDARKARDLARLNVSFLRSARITRTDRLRLLLAYMGRSAWKKWWKAIAAASRAKVQKNRRQGRVLG